MKIKTNINGASPWVANPFYRDTTRGTPNLDSCPSLHASKVEASMRVAMCQCCGINFGYETSVAKVPAYCPSHKWLGEKRRLGVPLLNGIIYKDRQGREITGHNIRWSYCFLEGDPKERETLFHALAAYVRILQLEENSLHMPQVIKTSKAVMVMDIQRLERVRLKTQGSSSQGYLDNTALGKFFDNLDRLYVDAL